MNPKDVKFLNQSGKAGDPLVFDVSGFAIAPDGGNAWAVADFMALVLTGVGIGTLKVLGSAQRLPPDFSSPSTILNSYAEMVLADYSVPGAYYSGSAGVTVSSSTKIVEVNTNLLTWIAITRSVDTVDALLTETNNQ